MHLYKPLLLLLLSITCLHAQEHSQPSSFNEYLATAGIKVKKETIAENLGYFINYEGYFVKPDVNNKKNKLKWFEGSITNKKGEVFTNLQLKFNTINNSLYVKENDKFYKLSQFRLSEFTLVDNGKERRFSKGFVIPLTTGISMEFEMKAPEFLRFLMAYENFDELEIASLTLGSQDQMGRIDIEINESTTVDISSLKSYLLSREGIKNVKMNSESTDTNANTYFEVLKDYGNFSLLKWNSKRLSTTEVVALAKNPNVQVFKEETYYFSNDNNEIYKFVFAKKSIQKSLEFVGVTKTQTLPSFPNEKKLLNWLDKHVE